MLSNCYFTVGDYLVQQVIGIPMGWDPAPYVANIFLFYYESLWLDTIKDTDNILAREFGMPFRFIDDLNAINDGGEFEKNFHKIYPIELEFKK